MMEGCLLSSFRFAELFSTAKVLPVTKVMFLEIKLAASHHILITTLKHGTMCGKKSLSHSIGALQGCLCLPMDISALCMGLIGLAILSIVNSVEKVPLNGLIVLTTLIILCSHVPVGEKA